MGILSYIEIKTELPKNYRIALTFAMNYKYKETETHKFFFCHNISLWFQFICIQKFWFLTFWQEKFRHGQVITELFGYGDFSVPWTFWQIDVLSLWTFLRKHFLAQGLFGMRKFCIGTFWHRDITASGHFSTKKFRHIQMAVTCRVKYCDKWDCNSYD